MLLAFAALSWEVDISSLPKQEFSNLTVTFSEAVNFHILFFVSKLVNRQNGKLLICNSCL